VLHELCSSSQNWKEGQERLYEFDQAVSDQVIACFLSYAYNGDYDVTEVLSEPDIEGLMNTVGKYTGLIDTDKAPHPLLLLAQIYVFADTYVMFDLGDLTGDKLKANTNSETLFSVFHRDTVFDLIEYAIDNLDDNDDLLEHLAQVTSLSLQYLHYSPRLIEVLLKSSGKFLDLLLPEFSGIPRKVDARACEAAEEVKAERHSRGVARKRVVRRVVLDIDIDGRIYMRRSRRNMATRFWGWITSRISRVQRPFTRSAALYVLPVVISAFMPLFVVFAAFQGSPESIRLIVPASTAETDSGLHTPQKGGATRDGKRGFNSITGIEQFMYER
jgi:hypothetical protein